MSFNHIYIPCSKNNVVGSISIRLISRQRKRKSTNPGEWIVCTYTKIYVHIQLCFFYHSNPAKHRAYPWTLTNVMSKMIQVNFFPSNENTFI
jgi:hypothetical protein